MNVSANADVLAVKLGFHASRSPENLSHDSRSVAPLSCTVPQVPKYAVPSERTVAAMLIAPPCGTVPTATFFTEAGPAVLLWAVRRASCDLVGHESPALATVTVTSERAMNAAAKCWTRRA